VEEQLSSTRPTPGGETLDDSSAQHRWITDNVALFAEEDLLLRAIAARAAEVAAGAQQRSDIVAAVAEVLPALREGGLTLSDSLVAKLAVYHESYAEAGQPVADVLRSKVSPGTTRYRELVSIANDLGVLLGATADAAEALGAYWSLGLPPDASDLEGGHPSYQEYVAHGVFAAYGRRTQGPASSLDDHYVGVFGDDWGSGEPLYDIGPSGTDEEHYEELDQYRLWLIARGLRALEAGGQKAIPHGTAKVDVDRLLTAEFGPWLLDRDDPAIRAAAALRDDRELAATLFNTPNTQRVLTIALGELRQLGLETISATASVREARANQAAEPWLPGNVGSLLSGARPPEVPAALAAQARTASTAALLAWVEQARLPHPAWPEGLGVVLARDNAEDLKAVHAEQLLVLKGLRRELEQAGPWWWPGNRRRRADLQARIAERAELVDELGAEVAQAEVHLGRGVKQQQAERAAWDASHGAVISRGVAAVDECSAARPSCSMTISATLPSTCWGRSGRRPLTRPAGRRGATRHGSWSGREPGAWPWSRSGLSASPVAANRTSREMGSRVATRGRRWRSTCRGSSHHPNHPR